LHGSHDSSDREYQEKYDDENALQSALQDDVRSVRVPNLALQIARPITYYVRSESQQVDQSTDHKAGDLYTIFGEPIIGSCRKDDDRQRSRDNHQHRTGDTSPTGEAHEADGVVRRERPGRLGLASVQKPPTWSI
jgi:hypothetical protein